MPNGHTATPFIQRGRIVPADINPKVLVAIFGYRAKHDCNIACLSMAADQWTDIHAKLAEVRSCRYQVQFDMKPRPN
jgi:hypothetical protein